MTFNPKDFIKQSPLGDPRVDWEKLRQFHDGGHVCAEMEATTERTLSNGTVAHWAQCIICGHGRAIRKIVGVKTMPWDDTLGESWRTDHDAMVAQVQAIIDSQREQKDTQFWHEYNVYLCSPEWAQKRNKVLARCGYVCEGCGERPAISAHHLTYVRRGREMLFDLVGVCQECHDAIHAGGQ
jgi:hypothetical protein